MTDIFGKRLLNARKEAGLSQDQLVVRIQGYVKKTSIAKYERGETIPDPACVEVLAKALGKDPEYFFRPVTLQIKEVDFKSTYLPGERRLKQLSQQATSYIERYLELLHISGTRHITEITYADTIIGTLADATEAAAMLRKKWELGSWPVHSVVHMLESKGIIMIDLPDQDDIAAISLMAASLYKVIMFNSNHPQDELRVKLMKELSLLLFTFPEELQKSEKEKLSAHFAVNMLLPVESLTTMLGNHRSRISLKEILLLSHKYGLPAEQAIKITFHNQLITRYTYLKLMEHMTTPIEGWSAGSFTPGHEVPLHIGMLLIRSETEKQISNEKARELFPDSPAYYLPKPVTWKKV